MKGTSHRVGEMPQTDKNGEAIPALTHLDQEGSAKMVDVGSKPVSDGLPPPRL